MYDQKTINHHEKANTQGKVFSLGEIKAQTKKHINEWFEQ
jgi:hypothetical protein